MPEYILDLLRLAIDRLSSWPVITLVALLTYKKQLAALLSRLSTFKAGKDGFSLDMTVAATVQAEVKPEPHPRLRRLQNIAVSATIQARQEAIRADLKGFSLPPQEEVDLSRSNSRARPPILLPADRLGLRDRIAMRTARLAVEAAERGQVSRLPRLTRRTSVVDARHEARRRLVPGPVGLTVHFGIHFR